MRMSPLRPSPPPAPRPLSPPRILLLDGPTCQPNPACAAVLGARTTHSHLFSSLVTRHGERGNTAYKRHEYGRLLVVEYGNITGTATSFRGFIPLCLETYRRMNSMLVAFVKGMVERASQRNETLDCMLLHSGAFVVVVSHASIALILRRLSLVGARGMA